MGGEASALDRDGTANAYNTEQAASRGRVIVTKVVIVAGAYWMLIRSKFLH